MFRCTTGIRLWTQISIATSTRSPGVEWHASRMRNGMDSNTNADMIRELMAAWDQIVAEVRTAYPKATDEERYQIARRAMDRAVTK